MLRFLYICGIIIKYSLLFLLNRFGFNHTPKNRLLKKFFEDAGGSFIKFGQLLALRVDVLPQEYSVEMIDLLDNVKPFSYEDVKEVFITDLGTVPEKIFKDFQKEPFASGSFGQVHAAKLDDGTIVAVKIMRPGIEEKVQIDFFIITIIALLAETFFKIAGLSWREFAEEFKHWTIQELDYGTEATNTERMYRANSEDSLLKVPKIYQRFSTKRILVQEYIDGFHLSRILRGLKDGRLDNEQLLSYNIDLAAFTHSLTQEILKQYFFYGFFHADLHPGNIILLQEERIALIDFGIMGNAMLNKQESIILFMKSVGNDLFKDSTFYFADIIGDDLKQLIQSAFPASVEQTEIDAFMHILTNHFSKTVEQIVEGSRKDLKEQKKDYSTMLLEIMNTTKSYRITIPSEMAILIKTLSTLGILCKNLNYEYKLQQELKYFFDTNPEDTIPKGEGGPTYTRISRERALERLNNWLSYLIEVDPAIYKLVNSYISKYNLIDK